LKLDTLTRKIPHFKGKFRLVRLLFRRKLRLSRDIVIQGKNAINYKLPNLVENIGFELFADGEYEPGTVELIVKHMPVSGSFIDIGANIGSIAIPVCKKRPDIKAICIEASPRVFGYLKWNIEMNGLKNCLPVNRIVSDADDRVVDFFSPEELFGKGSVSPVFTKSAEKGKSITLDTLLLENNISQPDFIKIDIEGYEYFVFKGGRRTLGSDQAAHEGIPADPHPTEPFEHASMSVSGGDPSSTSVAQGSGACYSRCPALPGQAGLSSAPWVVRSSC